MKWKLMEQAFIWYNINFYKEEFIGFEAVNIKLTGFYYLIRITIVKTSYFVSQDLWYC